MKIGLVGLGKMGENLALNMKGQGINVVGYSRNKEKVSHYIEKGLVVTATYEHLINRLDDRKIVWLMVPAGEAVDDVIKNISPFLKNGDVIIDGGNSKYQDTMKRAKILETHGIQFLDVGTSGGIDGALNGACMMIGGKKELYEELEPLFTTICAKNGQAYMGPSGSGHFVKMVHNGIEYGMMAAIGEGFEILKESEFEFNNCEVAKVWANGSIIESLLMDMASIAFAKNESLEGIVDKVDDSGEGLWTVEEALRLKLPAYVITSALMKRFESQQNERFSNKVVAALRNEFGGHKIYEK